jgi:hypothetical protein
MDDEYDCTFWIPIAVIGFFLIVVLSAIYMSVR